MTKTLVVSSSFNPVSRSNRLASLVCEALEATGDTVTHLQLKDIHLPDVTVEGLLEMEVFRTCYEQVREADALIFATPVYNWTMSAELKKFIEVIGSTNATHPSAFFDKLVSFIFAAGLPHSYMVLQNAAIPLMLDFRCIINPTQAYLHNRHWTEDGSMTADGQQKLDGMIRSHRELAARLKGLKLTEQWTV